MFGLARMYLKCEKKKMKDSTEKVQRTMFSNCSQVGSKSDHKLKRSDLLASNF